MADESVVVLIEGEDNASEKLAQFTAKVDATATKIKATADKTKKSTEITAAFASAFGGSELGGFASQLGGITEKIGSFSEMAKNGGTSSFAFKAGLAAIVGVAAFEVGKALGNAIFQVDEWNRKLEESRERFKEIGNETAKLQEKQFNADMEDIEIIKNPEEKQAAYKQMLDVLNKDLAEVQKRTINSRQAAEAWRKAWQITGERKAEAQMAQDQFEADKERQKILLERRQQLLEITSEETQQRELRKQQIAAEEEAQKTREAVAKSEEATVQRLRDQLAIEQAIGKEKFSVQAATMATDPGRQAEIAGLLEQQDALQKQREAEKLAEDEKKAAAKEEQARIQKSIDLKDNEIQKLRELELAITGGKEASEAFRLEQEGLSKADAEFIAKEKERLAELQKAKDLDRQRSEKMAEAEKQQQPLQAVESRFLRTAGTGDPARSTAENTKRMADNLARLIAIQEAKGNTENADRLRKKQFELEPIA